MKKLLLLCILLGCAQCATNQRSMDTTDTSITSVVENKKLNVVYRGVANPFTIYMPNTDSINVSGSGVKKINNNEYHIYPSTGWKMDITIIGYKNGKELIDKREFRILDLERPYTSIRNQYKAVTLTKEELADATIKVLIPQFIMELPEIASFQYQINEGEFIENKGNTFNESAKKQIVQLQAGDSVLINHLHQVNELPNVRYKSIEKLNVYIE